MHFIYTKGCKMGCKRATSLNYKNLSTNCFANDLKNEFFIFLRYHNER